MLSKLKIIFLSFVFGWVVCEEHSPNGVICSREVVLYKPDGFAYFLFDLLHGENNMLHTEIDAVLSFGSCWKC